jgi:hypothetical protein
LSYSKGHISDPLHRTIGTGIHRADLRDGKLSGTLFDNWANAQRSGSGFNPLYHSAFPGQNIYRDDFVGLNFEHIFNGVEADHEASLFAPRKDPCVLVVHSASSASLCWPARDSVWGMECGLRYSLSGECVDLEFKATPTRDRFGLGYVSMMWMSLMNHTRDRQIHFYGMNGKSEGWVTFGEDIYDGFETGTISCYGVPDLPYEAGQIRNMVIAGQTINPQTINIVEHPYKKFLLPFYYGLVAGDDDSDPSTENATMAYIMMFDQKEAIRFALWNFITDATGKPDRHSPAWDWQFVIRNPVIGKTYGYNARVMYKPFVNAEDIKRDYIGWVNGL